MKPAEAWKTIDFNWYDVIADEFNIKIQFITPLYFLLHKNNGRKRKSIVHLSAVMFINEK